MLKSMYKINNNMSKINIKRAYMPVDLSFEKICPFIRYARIINIKANNSFKNVKSYDCRLFYVLDGKGSINVLSNSYEMSSGSLIIWQPDNEYSINPDINNDFNLIGINFDYTFDMSNLNTPIPPSKVELFDNKSILIYNFTDTKYLNKPLFFNNINIIEPELLEIVKEYKNKKIYYEKKISGILLNIITTLLRKQAISFSIVKNSENIINNIIDYIHINYENDINNKLLGEIFNYHPNYINKLMILNTGTSLHKYLLNYRISKAINLIQTTNLQLNEICFKVGFKDFAHFSKYFKKKTNHNPSDYKNYF